MSIDFPYQIDWADPFVSSFAFKTAESVSRLGIRQRGALKQTPLKSFEFTSTLKGQGAADSLHIIRNNQVDTFSVPNWQVPRAVTAKSVSTFTTFTVQDDDSVAFESISSGDRIFVFADEVNYAFANVILVSSSTVMGVNYKTYKVADVLSWVTSESDIYLFKTYQMLPEIQKSDFITDDLLSLRCKWTERVSSVYNPTVLDAPSLTCFPDACLLCESNAIAEMFLDPCDSAYTSNGIRPVYRGADLGLPDKMYVSIDSTKFFKDSHSSHSGSFAGAKNAFNKPFTLEFVQDFVPVTPYSRHWHNCTSSGLGFIQIPNEYSKKYVWAENRNYIGDDNNNHVLEVRFVLEIPDGSDNSGTTGAWGSLFHIYAFTDEIPYVEGASVGGVSFYRDDPCVYVDDTTQKVCHPQLLLVAHVPTTMESCCPSALHDPLSPKTAVCSLFSGPGLPWTSGTDRNASLFSPTGGYLKAITLGGGCVSSKIYDLITIENQAQDGLTHLYTTAAGYDNDTGVLLTTSAISCKPRCYPQVDKENCCIGYTKHDHLNDIPMTPCVGSTKCWSSLSFPESNVVPRICCFYKDSYIRLTLNDKCFAVSLVTDGDCNTIGGDTVIRSYYSRTIDIPAYEIVPNCGSESGVIMSWRFSEDDPTYVNRDFNDDFSDNSLGAVDQLFGSWTAVDGYAEMTDYNPGGPFAGLLTKQTDEYMNVHVETDVIHGDIPAAIFTKTLDAGGGSWQSVYGQVNPLTNKIGIYKMVANVVTTLLEEDLGVVLGDGYHMVFDIDGSEVSFSVGSADMHDGHTLSGKFCTLKDLTGFVGVGHTIDDSLLQGFDNLVIEDGDATQSVIYILYTSYGWQVQIGGNSWPGVVDCPHTLTGVCYPEACGGTCIGLNLMHYLPETFSEYNSFEIGPVHDCAFVVGNDEYDCECGDVQPLGYPDVIFSAEVRNNLCGNGQSQGCDRFSYTLCTVTVEP